MIREESTVAFRLGRAHNEIECIERHREVPSIGTRWIQHVGRPKVSKPKDHGIVPGANRVVGQTDPNRPPAANRRQRDRAHRAVVDSDPKPFGPPSHPRASDTVRPGVESHRGAMPLRSARGARSPTPSSARPWSPASPSHRAAGVLRPHPRCRRARPLRPLGRSEQRPWAQAPSSSAPSTGKIVISRSALVPRVVIREGNMVSPTHSISSPENAFSSASTGTSRVYVTIRCDTIARCKTVQTRKSGPTAFSSPSSSVQRCFTLPATAEGDDENGCRQPTRLARAVLGRR